MSGELAQFIASLAAIAVLVLAVHLAGFSRPAGLRDEREALDIARHTPGGFSPVEVALDADGRGALLRDRRGRVLLLAPLGSRYNPVLLDSHDTARVSGDRLVILLAARKGTALTLKLGDDEAQRWANHIASNEI